MSAAQHEFQDGVRSLIGVTERCLEECLDSLIEAVLDGRDRPRVLRLAVAVADWETALQGWRKTLRRLETEGGENVVELPR